MVDSLDRYLNGVIEFSLVIVYLLNDWLVNRVYEVIYIGNIVFFFWWLVLFVFVV